jgi:hypothetical protein
MIIYIKPSFTLGKEFLNQKFDEHNHIRCHPLIIGF